jgi:hypothetical protein
MRLKPCAVNALATLGDCERCHARPARGRAGGAKPAALQAFAVMLAKEPAGPVFDEATRALRFTERDFSRTARDVR